MPYHWRELAVADIPAWSALTRRSAEADDSGWWQAEEELATGLSDPHRGPTVSAWEGERLVAAGKVSAPKRRSDGTIRASFAGTVEPDRRGRGLGSELLTRLEAATYAHAGARFPGEAIEPSSDSFTPAAAALFAARGYQPVRWFVEMAQPLSPEGAEDAEDAADGVGPGLGAGRSAADYDPALDEALRVAHRTAFAGHWGFVPPDDFEWNAHYTRADTFRPDCSVLALGAERVVGFVLGFEFEAGQLYVGSVGVVPEARRQGLATELMRRCIRRAAAAGYRETSLHVDSENADGAGGVYVAVGYAERRRHAVYRKLAAPALPGPPAAPVAE